MRTWLLLSFLISISYVYGQIYETQSYGFWSNTAIWKDGLKPGFTFSDTVIIKHPIAFDSTLIVLPDGYLKIDSSGALCGHKKIITYSTVHVYGYFQVDTVKVDGGYFKIFGPGDCVATYQTQVTNGGMLSLTGGSLAVGPWFDCRESDFFYLANLSEAENQHIKTFPNPVSDYLTIEGNTAAFDLKLMDAFGKVVLENKAQNIVDLSFAPNGLYYLQFFYEGKIQGTKKVVVCR